MRRYLSSLSGRPSSWVRGRLGKVLLVGCSLLVFLSDPIFGEGPEPQKPGPPLSPPAVSIPAVIALPSPEANGVVVAALELLRDECVSCHRAGKSKGGLKVGTLEGIKAGGESGPLIVPGKAAESLLISVLQKSGDPHMPPKKQLSLKQIEGLKTWINTGAAWDATVMDRPPRPSPMTLRAMAKGVHPSLAVAFSPDGAQLAVTRGGKVEIRDAKQDKYPIKVLIDAHVDPVQSLAWSKDGAMLITGGFRRIRCWNSETGAATGDLTEGIVGEVTALSFSVAGDVLWIADSLASRGGFVHRIDWPSRRSGKTWKAHEDSLYGMSVSADGRWLATAGADRLTKRWDVVTSGLVATYEGHTNQVLGVTFDSVLPRLATTGADREIKVWNRDSREQDAVLGDKKQVYSALCWSRDGSRLVGVTDKGNGTVFSAIQSRTGEQRSETAKVLKLKKVDAVLQSLSITADGAKIVAGSADGRIFVWNGTDGKLMPIE